MIFYDRDWNELGSKAPDNGKTDLADDIEASTGITRDFTSGARSIQTASISKRMSWAARRITSREEEIAYCLLGVFDISMPMLYGEGKRAFLRLQEEIMRASDDHNLFAWTDAQAMREHGLLADSPSAFLCSDKFVPFAADVASDRPPHPPVVTSRGLNIELGLLSRADRDQDPLSSLYVLAMLECGTEDDSLNHGYVGILLTRAQESPRHYTCVTCHKLLAMKEPPLTTTSIFVRQKTVHTERTPRPRHFIRPVRTRGAWGEDVLFLGDGQSRRCNSSGQWLALHALGSPTARYPNRSTDSSANTIALPKGPGLLAAYTILTHPRQGPRFVLLIGSDLAWELCFDVWEHVYPEGFVEIRELGDKHDAASAMPKQLREAYFPHILGTKNTRLPAFDVSVDKLESADGEKSSGSFPQARSFNSTLQASAQHTDHKQAQEAQHRHQPTEEVVLIQITWHDKERPEEIRPQSKPATEVPAKSHHRRWRLGSKEVLESS